MNERTLRRQVVVMLGITFTVFTVLFIVTGSFLSLKLFEEGKGREYMVIGKCFNYVISNAIFELSGFTEHVVFDVDGILKSGGNLAELAEDVAKTYNLDKVYVVSGFGKVLYPDSTPGKIMAVVNEVIKSGKKTIRMLFDANRFVIVAAAPLRTEKGVVVLSKDLSPAFEEAGRSLGGKFEVVTWNKLPDEILAKFENEKVDRVVLRRGNVSEIYYAMSTPFSKNEFFIHWTEPSGKREIVVRSTFLVLALSVPMFAVIFLMINLLRKKIFENFVDPLERMVSVLDDVIASTSSSSEELAASSQELAANTRNLEEKGSELSELSSEMLEDLKKTRDFAESVAEFSGFLKKSLENLEDINTKLVEAMKTINKMGGLIQQIGERIVVLSINASIEGSREQIDREAIKALSEEIAKLSETTTERVSEIFASIQESQDRLADMEGALKSIKLETEKLETGSTRLLEMIKSNAGEFERITFTIQSMFTSIEEINFASQNLAEAATELSQKAYDAQKVIDEFLMRGKKIKNEGEGGREDA